jgi:hypothetical protein
MTGPRLKSGDIRSVGFLWATACEGKYSHVAKLPRLLENKNEEDGWRERKKDEGEVAMSGLFARQARVHYEY